MKNPYGPDIRYRPGKAKVKRARAPAPASNPGKFAAMDSRQLDYEATVVSCLFHAELGTKYASRITAELIDDPIRRAICRAAKKEIEEGHDPHLLAVGTVLASANGELLNKDALPIELRLLDECTGAGGELAVERAIKFLVERRKNTEIQAFVRDAHEGIESGNTTPECVRAELEKLQSEHDQQEEIGTIQLMNADELGISEPIDWVWHGYLAPGKVTLLTGIWKGGKTTLIANLLKLSTTGGSLIGKVKKCNVIVISEESNSSWARRRATFGFGSNVYFLNQIYKGKCTWEQWAELMTFVGREVERLGIELVIIDTLVDISPVLDENDAIANRRAMLQTRCITGAGAALLAMNHPNKSGGGEFKSSRGTGDLPAFVDVIMELKRLHPDDLSDTRRVILAASRDDETLPQAVIDFNPATKEYEYLGTRSDAVQQNRVGFMEQAMAQEPDGITIDSIEARWPSSDLPTKKTIRTELNKGLAANRYFRTGKGTRGNPHRFSIFDSAKSSHSSERRRAIGK